MEAFTLIFLFTLLGALFLVAFTGIFEFINCISKNKLKDKVIEFFDSID